MGNGLKCRHGEILVRRLRPVESAKAGRNCPTLFQNYQCSTTLWIRSAVKEPEKWKQAKAEAVLGKELGAIGELFTNRRLRRNTLAALMMAISGQAVFWGIAVPWLVCVAFTTWFCFFSMADDDLGRDPGEESGHE